MEQADQIIDLGPDLGINGGELIYQGKLSEIYKEKRSLTTQYLSGSKKIETPLKRRDWKHFVKLDGIDVNNIKKMDVKIPLD